MFISAPSGSKSSGLGGFTLGRNKHLDLSRPGIADLDASQNILCHGTTMRQPGKPLNPTEIAHPKHYQQNHCRTAPQEQNSILPKGGVPLGKNAAQEEPLIRLITCERLLPNISAQIFLHSFPFLCYTEYKKRTPCKELRVYPDAAKRNRCQARLGPCI